MDTLEKFIEWDDRHRTHVDRHLIVLNKQIDNLRSCAELFGKYPVDSVEFRVEIERLYLGIRDVVDEMREVSQSFGNDSGDFVEILESMKESMKRKVKRERSKSG